jgi:hypothetical protein
LPGGTKENHDETGLPEYEAGVLTTQPRPSVYGVEESQEMVQSRKLFGKRLGFNDGWIEV